MLRLLLILALTLNAHALNWEKIFKPQAGWQTSTTADPDGKALKIITGEKPFFITNALNPKKAGYLQTAEQFGDCTVEAEFLIPQGSNSGIYLQGRYEIQILDSHGKDKPTDGDMGAVYHRWDDKRTPKGFEGHAPKVNAAQPAGQWQKLLIKFRAPRFNKDGTLLEKPRFLSVHLNGQLVQQNVTLHGPTRSAQRSGFTATDHHFIQGDHGPIAFRKFLVTPGDFSQN
ncbi:MAG: 3-keto-disaccharide hydrolase [Verrucomicrobiaceae bacterium]